MKFYIKTPLLFIIYFFCTISYAQNNTGNIKGILKDSLGIPVENAAIFLEGTALQTSSNGKGAFTLNDIPEGTYTLHVSILSHQPYAHQVTVRAGETEIISIVLKEFIGQGEEVTITTTGIREQLRDVPGTVNVITQKEIAESGAQSVGQIITRVPGVNYLDEDGRGLKPNIGLRGLDPNRNRNLLVLIDGKFPIGMSYYGDPAAYYMTPLEQVDRIEVIKGASPVLYGGYSVGGVVNMITRSGTHAPETRVKLGYGSYHTLNAHVSTSADNGKFGYYLSGLRRQGDGYRDRSKFGVNDYTVKLASRPDSTTELSVYLNAYTENSQTPGGLTQAEYEQNPRQSHNPHDQFNATRFSGALTWKKRFGQYATVSSSAYGNYFVRDWWIARKDPKAQGILRDIHSIGNVTDFNYSKKFLGRNNSFIAGVRVHSDRLDDMTVQGDTNTSRTGSTIANMRNHSFIYEGYIYDEFELVRNLTVAPGVRYTSVNYNRENFTAGSKSDLGATAVVYSAGFIYKLPGASRIYGTASRGFNPPTINSALDPGTVNAGVNLKPEISHNYEAGVRLNPVSWISCNVSGYLLYFKDKIITVSGVNRNAGNSFHRGIEMELEVGPRRGLKAFVNGAVQKATFTSGEDEGKILPYAPQRLAALGLRYQLFFNNSTLVFNLYDNYTGKQYNDAKNTEAGTEDGSNGAIPAYNVMNFTINYNTDRWGIFFNAYNITDEKYFTVRQKYWGGIIPSPGRNFMAGVTVKI